MKHLLFTSLLICFFYDLLADTLDIKKPGEVAKKGFSFGVLPALAYDTDLGYRYGVITNLYHYGDGRQYPNYKHSLYLEWSRTTKGAGDNTLIYDSKYIIPNTRLSAELAYLTHQAMDFYGFNGYESYFNPEYQNPNSKLYPFRMYYRMKRETFKLKIDLSAPIKQSNLYWYAGYNYLDIKADTVDLPDLNKDLSNEKKIAYTSGGLLQDYINNGVIPDNEKNGRSINLLRIGLFYDNRDTETTPGRGIFSDIQFMFAPDFLQNQSPFSKIAITHRHYIPIRFKKITFAYRLSYQSKVTGHTPYYFLSNIMNIAPSPDRDGLGGARSLRGVLRNRVVGDGFIFTNIELRIVMLRLVVFKQNISASIAPFADAGMVIQPVRFEKGIVPSNYSDKSEKIHVSLGSGFYAALNENFVAALNIGKPLDKQDGNLGVYINMGYLF